jgi:hypothetical protein
MRRASVFAGAMLLTAACLVLTSGRGAAGGKAGGPNVEMLIEQDAKILRDILGKGALDKKGTRKAQSTAFLIAVYADLAGKGETRDAALKVVQLVTDNKAEEAAKLAATLTPPRGGKAGPAPYAKALEFDVVMKVFSSERSGGYGLEKELEELTDKNNLAPEDLARLSYLGDKMAVIAHATNFYTDAYTEKAGKKSAESWKKLSGDFHAAALALSTAARAKNGPGAKTALEKVNGTCLKCHDVFR